MPVGVSTANIPIAEPVYPPGGRPRDPAEVRRRIITVGATAVLVVTVAVTAFVVVRYRQQKQAVQQSLRARATQFADAELRGPMGLATARRLGHLALFSQPVAHERNRPTIEKTARQLRILAVHAQPLDVVVPDADRPQIVFVGYAVLDQRARELPDSRAIDTALAAIAATREPGDPRNVTLVHWAADSRGGALRVLPIDFSAAASRGVVFSAIDGRTPEQAVAFALGDPVTGDGVYISDWAEIPPVGPAQRT